MPRERKTQFDILTDLKDLSDEADRLAQYELQDDPGLDDWFASIRETITKIRDCESINDIKYPPGRNFFLDKRDKKNKNVDSAIPETQRINIHPKKDLTVPSETDENSATKQGENYELVPFAVKLTKCDEAVSDCDTKSNEKIVTPASSLHKKVNSAILLHPMSTPKMDVTYNKIILENNNMKSQHVMQTPILNRTFDKIINKTLILDSGSSISSSQKSKIANVYDDSGMKTRSNSRKESLENKVVNSNGMKTRSASKKKSLKAKVININGTTTRSGSKRKSSSKNEASKKQKTDLHDIPVTTSIKTAQPRHPLLDKNTFKTSVLTTESKSKISAVIVPPVLPKHSVVSKEKQILEEIKKKEEKANQNIKKVLAERQQKAEQNKKNREEKRTKTLQKRMQMEKEKEERLEKREAETKVSQVKVLVTKENVKNPVKKTRTKELIEQHVKEDKSSVLTTVKQNDINADVLTKTPVNRKSEETESYELTPLPDSSTYNFSEDEDDKPSGKPIPMWAQGVHLKSALIQQYYNPVNTDALFGSHIDTPNLAEIFRVNKKCYQKRTSSAIWNSPPDRSFRH